MLLKLGVWLPPVRNAAPVGPVAMAIEAVPLWLLRMFPCESSAVTATLNVPPALALAGGWVGDTINWPSAPATMLVILPLFLLGKPLLVATSDRWCRGAGGLVERQRERGDAKCRFRASRSRSTHRRSSVELPGLFPVAAKPTVIGVVYVVTAFPSASAAVTVRGMATPSVSGLVRALKISCETGPATTGKAAVVTVKLPLVPVSW